MCNEVKGTQITNNSYERILKCTNEQAYIDFINGVETLYLTNKIYYVYTVMPIIEWRVYRMYLVRKRQTALLNVGIKEPI